MLDIHKGNVLNKPILGLVDSQDSQRRGTSNRPDDQYRLKLVERVSRLQNDVAIRRMDFDEARKRLEADEESLRIAQEALRQCDSDATEAVIRSTKRPRGCLSTPTSACHRGKERVKQRIHLLTGKGHCDDAPVPLQLPLPISSTDVSFPGPRRVFISDIQSHFDCVISIFFPFRTFQHTHSLDHTNRPPICRYTLCSEIPL